MGYWVLGGLLVLGRVATAGQFDSTDLSWSGCSELRKLAEASLGPRHIQFVSGLDYSTLQPRDAILLLNPSSAIRFRSFAAFLAKGGRAAVLDDYGTGGQLLERFSIGRKALGAKPQWLAEGHEALPVAFPVLGDPESTSAHPMIRGVGSVVANRPVALNPGPDVELTPLLTLPLQQGAAALFAVTGVIGNPKQCQGLDSDGARGRCGRLVAVADSSIFINLMMGFSGNREFAIGLLEYLLAAESWDERGGTIFVVSNEFSQVGHFPGTEGLRGELVDSVSHWLDQLANVRSDGVSARLTGAIALLMALGLAAWAVGTGAGAAPAWKPRFALPVPQQFQGGFLGRYAALASVTEDRAMLLLELHKTFAAQLCFELDLAQGTRPASIVARAQQLGQLDAGGCRRLQRLFSVLQAGETAILSGRRLKLSNRRLRDVTQQIVDTLTAMKTSTIPPLKDSGPVA